MNLFKGFSGLTVRLLRVIFMNWQAKLGSFLVATLFYLNLQSSKILVKTVDIPIEYPRLPITWNYDKANEKTLKVRVEGFRDLVNYHTQFMKVIIDPNDLSVGENYIDIKKIWGANSKIKVTPEIDRIKVLIEQNGTKIVPVDILFEDDLPTNFVRTSFFIRPSTVTISGPKQTIDGISRYILGSISLKDVKESFTRSFKPVNLPKGVILTSKIKEFQVRVNILKGATDIGEQIVGGIPVKCEGLNENLQADLSVDEISLKFNSPKKISSFEIFKGIKATLPCNSTFDEETNKIVPSTNPVFAKVRVSKDNNLKSIEILSIIPERIKVTYKIRKKVLDEVENFLPEDPAFDNIIFPDDNNPEEPRMK